MKYETSRTVIVEFMGLRTKTLPVTSYTKEAKGIKQSVVKKNIIHEDYKEILTKQTQRKHKMTNQDAPITA